MTDTSFADAGTSQQQQAYRPCDPAPSDEPTVRRDLEIISARAQRVCPPDSLLQISRVHPANDKLVVVGRYTLGDIDRMVTDTIGEADTGHNVYIELRTLRPDTPGGKLRGDASYAAAVFGLVRDNDGDTGRVSRAGPPPSMKTETSPGNGHDRYFASEPLSVEVAQEIGQGMRAAGGDHDTGNPTQPYRIAGTPNYPNLAKQRRGRFEVHPTSIIEHSGVTYTADELRAAFPAPKKEQRTAGTTGGAGGEGVDWRLAFEKLPGDLQTLIRDGAQPGEDRSARFHGAVCQLKSRGWSVDNIFELLDSYPKGIAQKYADRLRRETERSFDKGDAPPDPMAGFTKKDEQDQAGTGSQHAGRGGVTLADFHAYMPMHSYIFAPSCEPWPASSVNSRIPPQQLLDAGGNPVLGDDGKPKKILANHWLDQNRPVEQMTWSPGNPGIIENKLISDGGWIERPGARCFNHYRPPAVIPGNASEAGPWIDHVRHVYPDAAEHVICWLAHRVQRPHEKINHALVLGGPQGIGKDTLLEPVKAAIGPWNFSEVSPQHMLGRFNGFVKSVILRISEARDLGDVNRYAFYDHMKTYTAAPPDVLRVDEKHLREYSVFNVCGVIITTNHKSDGIYLPADDRRHHVSWSCLNKESFESRYWDRLWGWYETGGTQHVAAYLKALDLSQFNPKAPPPKTPAFWDIVASSAAPEDAELADALDQLGSPAAVTLRAIMTAASSAEFMEWLKDRKNSRQIPHRLEDCGYTPIRNAGARDGLWKIGEKRQVIYAKAELPERERLAAVKRLYGVGR